MEIKVLSTREITKQDPLNVPFGVKNVKADLYYLFSADKDSASVLMVGSTHADGTMETWPVCFGNEASARTYAELAGLDPEKVYIISGEQLSEFWMHIQTEIL